MKFLSPLFVAVAVCAAAALPQEPQPTRITPGGVQPAPAQEPKPAPAPAPVQEPAPEPAPQPEVVEEVEEVVVEEAVIVESELVEVRDEQTGNRLRFGGSIRKAKKPLDMETASHWGRVGGTDFTSDGKWVRFTHSPAGEDAEDVVHVRETRGEREHLIERSSSVRFSEDSKLLIYLESAEKEEKEEEDGEEAEEEEGGQRGQRGGRNARGGRRGPEPRTLVMLDLETGERREIPRVLSYSMPAESDAWLAYEPAPPEKKEEAKKGDQKEAEGEEKAEGAEPEAAPSGAEAGPRVRGEGRRGGRGAGGRRGRPQEPAPAAEPEVAVVEEVQEPEAKPEAKEKKEEEEKEKKPKTSSSDGDDLVLYRLADGSEQKLEHVSSQRFLEDGSALLYITTTKADGGDGLWLRDLEAGTSTALLEGEGAYRSLTLSEEENRLAFASNVADFQAEEPAWQIYYTELDGSEAFAVVAAGHPGIPTDYRISAGGLGFSDSGARLYFNVQPPEPEEAEEVEDDEKVVLDVWAWTDDELQPQQLRSASRDRNPSYTAVVHLDKVGRVVTLENEQFGNVSVPDGRDARWGLASDASAWAHMRSWETDLPRDVYLVDVMSGESRQILAATLGGPRFSPTGKWLSWYEPKERQYYAMQVPDGKPQCVSRGVPHPLYNELDDRPQLPNAYGSPGWLQDDAGLLVYDKHDLWLLDPSGQAEPICVTEGVGRERGLRFRRMVVDPDATGGFRGFGGGSDGIDPEKPLWLSAFHLTEKSDGWWKDSFSGGAPVELLTMDKSLSNPRPAENGGLMSYTRSDFREYPDVWLTDMELSFHEKISDANPQQAEYLWGDTELFAWNSSDGTPLQGILVKPENFDPAKKWPMVVYFYERMSDQLHNHRSPGPGGSSVAWPYYASNGFLVFVPDIPYRVGYPGESAENAVLPALSKLIDTGYVDEQAIGVQGHSWGGYQIAHLVTRTNMFTAAISGAPVSNMVSAYGGIRWSSGMSRMFQYERTQSRLGGTLWEVPMRFLENSPIFYIDKVETPVLVLHNDEDGAVPWYQGIEFFVAMRRLAKPCWMLNYNGEDHGLRKTQNRRDYAVRMYQFLDHYLRGAPMPVWMHEGIPATDKGRTLGLDYVPGTGFDTSDR